MNQSPIIHGAEVLSTRTAIFSLHMINSTPNQNHFWNVEKFFLVQSIIWCPCVIKPKNNKILNLIWLCMRISYDEPT